MPSHEETAYRMGKEESEERIAELEAALRFIAEQEPLTFAECSVAEAIIGRAKAALSKSDS